MKQDITEVQIFGSQGDKYCKKAMNSLKATWWIKRIWGQRWNSWQHFCINVIKENEYIFQVTLKLHNKWSFYQMMKFNTSVLPLDLLLILSQHNLLVWTVVPGFNWPLFLNLLSNTYIRGILVRLLNALIVPFILWRSHPYYTIHSKNSKLNAHVKNVKMIIYKKNNRLTLMNYRFKRPLRNTIVHD